MKSTPVAFAVALLAAPAFSQFNPPVAADINPDPTIVEVDITADVITWQYTPGVDTTVWAYNGSVPGPTIHAEVGQTLRVNFTNNLPEETTIHWHGVDTPATMDGSHVSQPLVPPGGTFTYEFTLLRANHAWYHPHVRPFDQIEKGLYGNLIVSDPVEEAAFGLTGLTEVILVFDDVLLDAGNQVVPAFSFTDPLQNALYHLNGREGNVLLVNGKEASTTTLNTPNGQPLRIRALNAANTTICRLDWRDPAVGMPTTTALWEIGSDGGLNNIPFNHPNVQTTAPEDHPGQVLLAQMGQGITLFPGERMDVIVTPIGSDGESFRILQKDWFRGRHAAVYGTAGQILLPDDPLDGLYPDKDYFDIVVQGPDPGTGEFTPNFSKTQPPVPPPVMTSLDMTFGHGLPNPATGDVTMFAQADFSSGSMVPLPAKLIGSLEAVDVNAGESWIWKVTNLTHGDHTFHTHGFFFQLIGYEWLDMDNPTVNGLTFKPIFKKALKDTIRIPARTGAKGRSSTITRLLVHFDDTGREGQIGAGGETPTYDINGGWESGGWLAHCHMLEHAAAGMLTFFEVQDTEDPFKNLGEHIDGSNGKASLTVRGDFTPGNPLQFDVVNALPNGNVTLVLGPLPAYAPIPGGILVPNVAFHRRGTTDAQGMITIDVPEWQNLKSGRTVYGQAIFADPGVPGGRGFTNALVFTIP